MANDCSFDMCVVGRNEESVARMGRILDYEDNEFFLFRVFCSDGVDKSPEKDGEFYKQTYFGDVAWNPTPWLDDRDLTCKRKNGAHRSCLQEICKALDVGVELWSEEVGEGYQAHIVVDHNGDLVVNESVAGLISKDEEDNDGPSALKDGMEGFGDFADCLSIYGEDNAREDK